MATIEYESPRTISEFGGAVKDVTVAVWGWFVDWFTPPAAYSPAPPDCMPRGAPPPPPPPKRGGVYLEPRGDHSADPFAAQDPQAMHCEYTGWPVDKCGCGGC